ncbi:MAG: ATP synthase F1 subunit epsilon [Raineya sp.]|jgi:F-type H+-transporting ATPase subunit epsilon|nr:ATP synthase F1 subunit epsilon [Raineya sp.]
MFLEIITPDKQIFSGEVVSATLPGKKGSFQVLNNHAAIISTLDAGTLKYKAVNKDEVSLEILGGVAEVLNNNIQVLIEGIKK